MTTLPPSPIAALQEAIEHTRRQLFPFRFDRWLALGLIAFLDQCGRGGGGINLPSGPGGTTRDSSRGLPDVGGARQWLAEHVVLIVVVAAVVFAVIVLIMALVHWLRSRGTFMYIDNVVTGRSDVKRPWREHAELASSYFAWTFGISLAVLVFVMVLLVPVALSVFRLLRGFDPLALAGVIGPLLILLAVSVAAALAAMAFRDFVAPLQFKSRQPFGDALRTFGGLLGAHPGAFVIYVLLKIVLAIVVGILGLLACCLTCCIGALPIVHHTLLQPIYYFERAWSLHLLRQMGHDAFAATATLGG
jgi:hypothetical protein